MSIEAEKAVLGIIISNPDRLHEAKRHIVIDSFIDKANAAVWASLCDLDANSNAIDVITVATEIERGWINSLPPMLYITKLVESAPSSHGFFTHIKLIKQDEIKAKLIRASGKIIDIAHSKISIDEKISRSQELIGEISPTSSEGKILSGKQAMNEYLSELEDRANGKRVGIGTGFIELDEKTGGLKAGDLVIVAGRPSMGKTTFALNICENTAINGYGTMIFSMEMTTSAIMEKISASLGDIKLNQLKYADLKDKFGADNWNALTRPVNLIRRANLHITDQSGLSISDVRSMARSQDKKTPLKVIMIDYLQLISASGENRVQAIAKVSMGLKQMAKELNCTVIALSQLNRAVESREDKEPKLSDLRECGQIEQDADLILMMYRPEYYSPDDFDAKGKAVAFIRKQRCGEVGGVPLLFDGACSRFSNYDGKRSAIASKEEAEKNAKKEEFENGKNVYEIVNATA